MILRGMPLLRVSDRAPRIVVRGSQVCLQQRITWLTCTEIPEGCSSSTEILSAQKTLCSSGTSCQGSQKDQGARELHCRAAPTCILFLAAGSGTALVRCRAGMRWRRCANLQRLSPHAWSCWQARLA